MLKIVKTIFVLGLLSSPALALAEKVVVIVNEANGQSMNATDVKAVYSDQIIQWSNGQGINSYNQPTKSAANETFSQKVLGMSATDAAKEWANRKITNTAKNPPSTKKEKLVILQVKKDANAIGYVSESALEGKDGVKVLFTVE